MAFRIVGRRGYNNFFPQAINYSEIINDISANIVCLHDWNSTFFQDSGATTPATGTDPVGYWQDRSGNGYHATRASDTTRPTLTTQNGKNVLNFDGANDWLHLALSEIAGTFTWIIAFQPDDVPGVPQYLIDIATGRLILAWGTGSGGGNFTSVYDGTWRDIALQTAGIQILTFELVNGTNTSKLYKNGIQIGSNFTYAQKALGGAAQAIGAFNNGAGTWFDGRICLNLCISGVLDATTFTNLHNSIKRELGFS